MDNRIKLEAAINDFLSSKRFKTLSGNVPSIANNESIEGYFKAGLNSDEEQIYEKIVATAAINSTYKSNCLPNKIKYHYGHRLAQECVEHLRYYKLVYLYDTNQINAKEYECKTKENQVAQHIARGKAIKNKIVYEVTKIGIGATLGIITSAIGVSALPPTVIGLITWGIINLIPTTIKNAINRALKDVTPKCKYAIVRAGYNLIEAGERLGSRIIEVTEKCQEKLYSYCEKIKKKVFQ